MSTIEEKLKLLLKTKTDIRNALKAKGVDILPDTPFSEYDVAIKAIQAGDLMLVKNMQELLDKGEVTEKTKALVYDEEADVFTGIYIYLDKTWQLMPTQLTAKAENIAPGYKAYGPDGVVEGNFTSDADATSPDIMNGKTAYVNGQKVTGNYVPLDTSDATALTTDLMFPKTAYVNGQKLIGAIQSEYEMTSSGMGYESVALTSSGYILDINEEYGIALRGTYQTTSFDIYEWKNNALGDKITTIQNSFINSSYGQIMHAQISKKLNELANLNIFYYQHTSGSATGYMCGFQFDPNTKTVLTNTKASSSCNALDARHVGNISVNPVYPNIVVVANQYYTTNGSSAVLKRYNPQSKVFDLTTNMGRYRGGGVTGDVCEWDKTGTILLHKTSKLEPKYVWFEKLTNSFATATTQYWEQGSGGQGSYIVCTWNDKYFFKNNTLCNISDGSVKKTYSNYSASWNTACIWTYDNYLFVADYSVGTLKCFMIDPSTLTLTSCFSAAISMTKPSTPARYVLGSPQAPQSQQHMYFKDMASVGFHFKFTDGVRTINSLDFGTEKLYNTSDADISAAQMLTSKTAYNKSGRVVGTMPNNGTYNRTMGNSALTLPEGYYAGGTITPPSFTSMSEYNTCLNISSNILA